MPRAGTEQNGGAAKGLRPRLIWTGIVFLVSVLSECGAGIAFLVPGCGRDMRSLRAYAGIREARRRKRDGNCLLCAGGADAGREPLCRESPAGKARNTADGGAAC